MHSLRYRVAGVAMALAAMYGIAAQAVPLTYDETIDGDIATTPTTAPFALDVGSNRIAGTTTAKPDELDIDDFSFFVSPDMRLDSITFEVLSADLLTDTFIFGAEISLISGSLFTGTELAMENVDFASTGTASLFRAQLPLESDLYSLRYSLIRPLEGGGSADYEITFDVAPSATIPEPGVLSLFATGALGLLTMRRRP